MLQYLRSGADHKIKLEDRLNGGSWVRAERPTDDEKAVLVTLGIDQDVLLDALDPHEVPRVEFEDDWTYFITRLPDVDDDFNDYTTPVLFALGNDAMFTVSRDSLGRLWQPFIDKTIVDTAQQTTLFMHMIDAIVLSYQRRVATINRQMRAATSDVRRLRSGDIATLTDYERKLNDYLDALIPTNTAVEKLLKSRLVRLNEVDPDLVEDLSIDLEQIISRCKSLLRTITNVRDSYRAVMDTKLNETIRLLTVVTVSLTIPTMVAGLFGMNVDIPGETYPYTFWIVIAMSALVAVALGTYFLRRR